MTHSPDTKDEKAYLLRPAVPGKLFSVVKVISWIELALFAALLVFWLAPGFEHETFIFGLSHGIGFCILAAVVLVACLAREAPYPLLAATMTPVGPVGSVIGIALIEKKGWGVSSGSSDRRPAESGENPVPQTRQEHE